MDGSSRLERLLALLLTQQLRTQQEKIKQLNVAGFTNTEIADIVGTTANVVSQVLYTSRRGTKRPAKRKKRGRKKASR